MPEVRFTFNGTDVEVEVGSQELLLDTVRDRLNSTSSRYSCGIGVCGSCTMLLDGAAVSSCLQFTQMAAGRHVETPDAVLAHGERFAQEVLDSFVDSRAYQCSYCIPAMALTVVSLLREEPDMSFDRLRHHLGGNLCRCGSYPQVVEAVMRLVKEKGEHT